MTRPHLIALLCLCASVWMIGGCTSFETKAEKARWESVDKLVECNLKAAQSEGLTCRQVYDLQSECYELWKMRRISK